MRHRTECIAYLTTAPFPHCTALALDIVRLRGVGPPRLPKLEPAPATLRRTVLLGPVSHQAEGRHHANEQTVLAAICRHVEAADAVGPPQTSFPRGPSHAVVTGCPSPTAPGIARPAHVPRSGCSQATASGAAPPGSTASWSHQEPVHSPHVKNAGSVTEGRWCRQERSALAESKGTSESLDTTCSAGEHGGLRGRRGAVNWGLDAHVALGTRAFAPGSRPCRTCTARTPTAPFGHGVRLRERARVARAHGLVEERLDSGGEGRRPGRAQMQPAALRARRDPPTEADTGEHLARVREAADDHVLGGLWILAAVVPPGMQEAFDRSELQCSDGGSWINAHSVTRDAWDLMRITHACAPEDGAASPPRHALRIGGCTRSRSAPCCRRPRMLPTPGRGSRVKAPATNRASKSCPDRCR